MYVPAKQLVMSGSQTYAQAFAQSLRDAERLRISANDLCAFQWQFRFVPSCFWCSDLAHTTSCRRRIAELSSHMMGN